MELAASDLLAWLVVLLAGHFSGLADRIGRRFCSDSGDFRGLGFGHPVS